ncbi:MAG: V-type ATPase subunit [Treponema sp.]|jgi:vacuolar-type H+-ATPase subunit C/Vma6|nr:V-type ATPase subunit [Treponema sp.]
MPGMGERAFVYAKACGMVGKSYTGSGVSKLNSVNRLSDLDRLIFSADAKDLPERELLPNLEQRIIRRSVDQIISIVSSFSDVPELLVLLVQSYEVSDLKTMLNALAVKDTKLPNMTHLGPFSTINFDAYPNLDVMLKQTEYGWILDRKDEISDSDKLVLLQIEIDQQYYKNLWDSLLTLPTKDCISIKKIIEEEIIIRNIVWALRFKTYYNMDSEKITERLVHISIGKGKQSLAQDALACLNFSLDSYDDWMKWKRASFVNSESRGNSWSLDPRYVQNVSAHYLYTLAKKYFHRRPFALDTAACFIKIKQYEEDLLTSVAEGLSFGMTAQDVLRMLEEKP